MNFAGYKDTRFLKKGSVSVNLKLFKLFFDLCCLTNTIAQVVQFGSANFTSAYRINGYDRRRINREYFFATYTVGNTSYGNGLVDSAMLLSNNSTFECLSTLTVSLFNLDGYAYSITNADTGLVFFQVLLG